MLGPVARACCAYISLVRALIKRSELSGSYSLHRQRNDNEFVTEPQCSHVPS
jgi:hypothetical protein